MMHIAKLIWTITFLIFESINNILYLVYSNKNKSIIIFDLIKEYKIKEIKNCHDEEITNFSHFLNKEDKQDLFISISANDNNLKLWNFNNFECILNLKNVNKNGFLDCACFFNDDNKNYIITCNHNKTGPSEPIKLFDFKGEKIQEIKKSNENTTILYIYKDEILSKKYIIAGNTGNVKSYIYNENDINLYNAYKDDFSELSHRSIIIFQEENITKLIKSSIDGAIRIWNFHSAKFLNIIYLGLEYEIYLYGICLWNKNNLIVGCSDKTIKIINLKELKVDKSFASHQNEVSTIKKINHPKYGECLITRARFDGEIKMWIKEN